MILWMCKGGYRHREAKGKIKCLIPWQTQAEMFNKNDCFWVGVFSKMCSHYVSHYSKLCAWSKCEVGGRIYSLFWMIGTKDRSSCPVWAENLNNSKHPVLWIWKALCATRRWILSQVAKPEMCAVEVLIAKVIMREEKFTWQLAIVDVLPVLFFV